MGREGKKGIWGATKMTGLTKSTHWNHLEIQFDEVGNPIGPNRAQFVTYLGMMIQTIMCIFKYLVKL